MPNELVYAKHGDTNMQIYDKGGGSVMEQKKGKVTLVFPPKLRVN